MVFGNDVEVQGVGDVFGTHGWTRRVSISYAWDLGRSSDLRPLLTSIDVLLVGKYEQEGVLHFAILDDACEFSSRLLHAVLVVAVDDEDEALCA